MEQRRAMAKAIDVRHEDYVGYYGGWTLSGMAVIATIAAVWVFGL